MNETVYKFFPDTYMGDASEADNNYVGSKTLKVGYFTFKGAVVEYRLFFRLPLFSSEYLTSGPVLVPGAQVSSSALELYRNGGDATTTSHLLYANTLFGEAVPEELTWNVFRASVPDNQWTGGEEYVDTNIVTSFNLRDVDGWLSINTFDHVNDAVVNRSGKLCMSSMRQPPGGPGSIPTLSEHNTIASAEGDFFSKPILRVFWEPPLVSTVGRLAGRPHHVGGLYAGRLI